MQLGVDWTTFKTFVSANNLLMQYVETTDTYYIVAINNSIELTTQVAISSPAGTDQTDFETNFKSNCVFGSIPNYVQVLGKDTLTLCPFGSMFTATANSVTTIDVEMPATMTLKGAKLFSPNAALGDWITVTVIDKNNIVGAGGTSDNPTVLGQYILSWYIAPGIWNEVEDVSISQTLLQGLYVRFTYTSVSTDTAPTGIVNFISYVGTP